MQPYKKPIRIFYKKKRIRGKKTRRKNTRAKRITHKDIHTNNPKRSRRKKLQHNKIKTNKQKYYMMKGGDDKPVSKSSIDSAIDSKNATRTGPKEGVYKQLVNCWRCVDAPKYDIGLLTYGQPVDPMKKWRKGALGCDQSKCTGWNHGGSTWYNLVRGYTPDLFDQDVKHVSKNSSIKTVGDQMDLFGRIFGMVK